MVAKQYK